MGERRAIARAGFARMSSRHDSTPVKISETIQHGSVKTLAVDVVKESLIVDQRWQRWNHYFRRIRGRTSNRHCATVRHVQGQLKRSIFGRHGSGIGTSAAFCLLQRAL